MAIQTAFGISRETDEALRFGPINGLLQDFLRANDLAVLYRDKSTTLEAIVASLEARLKIAVKERDEARAAAEQLRRDTTSSESKEG